MHPTLRRLHHLAAVLAEDPHVEAVLGLGSAGQETDRFDDHSDIDFFVIVDTASAKRRYLHNISWLTGLGSQVAYSFVNDANGRKALLADGLFLEYAIFTPDELAELPFAGARVVWTRGRVRLQGRAAPPASAIDTIDFHLNEALTNLYVGLHRQERGEHLTALRFIQVYAVDRVLALVRLDHPTSLKHPDPFEASRRIEQATLPAPLPLDQMIPGYTRNRDAARTILNWLTAHYQTDPVITEAVRELAKSARQDSYAAPGTSPGSGGPFGAALITVRRDPCGS